MPEKSNRRTVMEHFNPILGYETTGPKFITCGESTHCISLLYFSM